jgi:hypothetical protein
MSVRRLRAAALPVLLLAVAVLAVLTAARAPQDAPPAEPALALPEPLGVLWAAWGDDLTADGQAYPVQLAALDRAEALYVLMTARAAQVAEAAGRSGNDASLAAASATRDWPRSRRRSRPNGSRPSRAASSSTTRTTRTAATTSAGQPPRRSWGRSPRASSRSCCCGRRGSG